MAGRSLFKKRVKFNPVRQKKTPAYSAWKKNKATGVLEAKCVACKRAFVAYHSSQLHLVAPSTGLCYYCRSHQNETGERQHSLHAINDERLFEQIGVAHEGRWNYRPEDIRYTTAEVTGIRAQTPLPHWSCCKGQARMPSQPGNRCSTAQARKRRVEERAEAERLRRHRANVGKVRGRDKLTRGLPKLPANLLKDSRRKSVRPKGETGTEGGLLLENN
jgi:hypothetical protein